LTLGKSKLLLVYCGAISRSIPKNGLERTGCCRMKGLSSPAFFGNPRKNSPTCSVRWDERRAIANRMPYESRLISKSALKSPSFTKIWGSTAGEIGANTGGVGRKMTLTTIAASRHWLTTTCIRGASRGGPARARWNSMLLKSETVGTSDAGSVPRSKHWPEPTTGDR
jgi:hypothetical protein